MRNFRTIAKILGVLLIISIIGVIILNLSRNAKLAIMVAPIDATVKINGTKYGNGVHKFFAGKVTVEISREDFDTKQYEIELKPNQTTSLNDALSQDGTFGWYKDSPRDYEVLKLVGKEESRSFIENTESAKHILSVLPLQYITMIEKGELASDGNPYYETTITNGTAEEGCKSILCLKIRDNTGNNETAKRLIEEAGFNYYDYEFIYE